MFVDISIGNLLRFFDCWLNIYLMRWWSCGCFGDDENEKELMWWCIEVVYIFKYMVEREGFCFVLGFVLWFV